MLEKVREPWKASRTKKILAYTVFGLICLTFVFMGIEPNTGGVGGTAVVATVNDTVISMKDFQERVSMVESQMGAGNRNMPVAQRQKVARDVRVGALNDLVSLELAYQSAEKMGILPTAAATREVIVEIPAFQENGRFARELYNAYLNYKSTTAAEFERKIKKQVAINQLQEIFSSALRGPKVLDQLEQEAERVKINLEYVKIDVGALSDSAYLDDSAVKAYLSDSSNEKKIKDYYGRHKGEFVVEPQVRARHILIKGEGPSSLQKAKEIREEAQKGGDFASLAQKYSEDEGTKGKGGDLDFFTKGVMAPEFEKAAFSLSVGELSEPVKTAFGYHLIKVEERQEGGVKPMAEAQGEIAKKLMGEEKKTMRLQEVSKILEGAENSGGDVVSKISQWMARYKLKWEETGEFSLGQYFVPKIGAGEEVFQAVATLRREGEIYARLVPEEPYHYVIRLKKKTWLPSVETKKELNRLSQGMFGGGAETLSLWIDAIKKDARVLRNEAALQL